ncbi:MAG: glucose-1-phosphate adenylyltransferase subunit GlgD [Bacilli bacterium]|nr:glucose-1-phosphate adenylyltransferase subunit GlgD [Bacilli bacterium]
MNTRDVIGMVDFHTTPSLSPLTDHRPLGSTSFLGRYALCDFALSNLCNSGISQFGLLVKDHVRSVQKHLGGMTAWVHNTKTGNMRVLFNEHALSTPERNTDLNNIKANDWWLYEGNADYILIVPAHIICSIDYRPILEKHIADKERITVIATKVEDATKEYGGQDILSLDRLGYVEDVRPNDGTISGPALCSMDMVIINRSALAELVHQYLPKNPNLDLRGLLYRVAISGGTNRVKCHVYEGYSRCFNSFQNYMKYSFEFSERSVFDSLFRPDWPIYTKTHDTPPAIYGETASVSNSVISNGATVEGTVINSIICRKVKVAKGAVVRNSIIFSNSKIAEGAVVENAVVDKQTIITRNHQVKGKEDDPVFVEQGSII